MMTFRLAAWAFFFSQAWPTCYGIQCSMLQTKRIYYTHASCEGQSASSCWTVVSFDLPPDLPGVPLRCKSVTLDSLTSVTGHYGLGLAVVHGHKPREPSWGSLPPSESQEDMDKDGLNYSIDTRVVEIGSGLRVLQVQLLYSEAGQGNISPTPGWSSTASSLQVHPGGKEIKLDVMFCSPEPEHWRYSRQRPSYLPRVEASSMESYSAQGLQLYQEDLPVVDWIAGLSKPSSTAVGRSRNLVKTDPATIVNTDNANVDGEAHRDSQSLSHSLRGGRRGLQNGPGPLPPSSGASSLEEPVQGGGGVLSNLGACDPYHEGDDWCSAAISPAESRALEIQGTEMYCSRECSHRGALWCNIFGKKNCRMCSSDCDEFCLGDPDCHCHKCPSSGASETWSCTVGADMACYDQITRQDYASLVRREQRLTCTPTCLEDGGGLWCDAMGVDGCRFCAVDCDEYCAFSPNPQECECVQCEDGLELPELPKPLSSSSSLPSPREYLEAPAEVLSCGDEEDGDAFCWGQVPEEAQAGFEAEGVGIECHSECLTGEVWPLWCFAQKTVGCRYCMESCEPSCGEGISECESCYTCGGNLAQ